MRWAVVVLVAAGCAPALLGAQEDCEWLPPTGTLLTRQLGASSITYVSRPNLRCRDGVRVRADSAVFYEASALFQFMGAARLRDPDIELEGDEVQYFQNSGRVQARGSARVRRLADDTRVDGEDIEILRANQIRPEDQMTVEGGRPHAVLPPRSGGEDADATPYEVDADRIVVLGSESFRAYGRVEIERDDLLAFGDTVEYGSGQLLLRRDARVESDRYDLSASLVLLQMPDDVIRQVVARDRAVLLGQDLDLRAPVIHLFLTDGLLDRLVATRADAATARVRRPGPDVGAGVETEPELETGAQLDAELEEHPERPLGFAQDFVIRGDSLEILAPLEVLQTMYAVGSASAVSTARDSINSEDTPEIARRDWIEGDTIVATFVPVAPADSVAAQDSTSADYRLEKLVAKLGARTLYRMPPSDTAAAEGGAPRFAVHYVGGDSITITLEGGEVKSMQVVGAVSGIHLEPPARGSRPDSAAVRPDSAQVRADSTRVRADIARARSRPEALPRRERRRR